MDISIVVSTRNRCQNLLMLLESLQEMVVPSDLYWEVIVVDNGSTDQTKEICHKFIMHERHRFKYLYESRQGKSIALNKGIDHARGSIMVFTDDDCVVDKFWIKEIMREFNNDPDLGILGGRVELYDKSDKPMSIITKREKVTLSTPRMLFDPVVIGCNMAARKNILEAIGKFDVLLGPGTKSNAISEDLDILYGVLRKGFKVIYFPSIIVYHNHGRKTGEEVDALLHKYYVGRGAFYAKYVLTDIEIAKLVFWDLHRILRNISFGKEVKAEVRVLLALIKGAISRMKIKNVISKSDEVALTV